MRYDLGVLSHIKYSVSSIFLCSFPWEANKKRDQPLVPLPNVSSIRR